MAEVRSDLKAERLINLTMALLATPRFLTKSEIFKTVYGYSEDGTSLESMSRKFERDKDELRLLGIEIAVGSNDPLFEDEQGYRIIRSSYSMNFQNLTRIEYSLISIAIAMWRNEYFSQHGQSALRKIQGLGLDFIEPMMPNNLFVEEVPHESFAVLWRAIQEHRPITFTYRSSTLRERRINPYTLTLWHSFWYLTGLDLDSEEIRTFKVLRIQGEPALDLSGNPFEVPADFSVREHLRFQEEQEAIVATLSIRKDRALSLRTTCSSIAPGDEWDVASKSYSDIDAAISELVQYGSSVRIDGPQALRDEFIRRISSLDAVEFPVKE